MGVFAFLNKSFLKKNQIILITIPGNLAKQPKTLRSLTSHPRVTGTISKLKYHAGYK